MKKNKMERKGTNRGFSLIEVLCAIVLLGLIAAPFLQMVYSSYSTNLKSKKYLAAADLSQTVMEAISAQTWEGSTGSIKKSTTDEEGNVSITEEKKDIPGLRDYYFDNKFGDTENYRIVGQKAPLYVVFTPDNVTKGNEDAVYMGQGYSDNPKEFPIQSSSDNSKKYWNYYFNGVSFGDFTFNVTIQFDVQYDLQGGSKDFYVVLAKVYVYDSETNALIESASTTVANTK